MDVDEQLTDVDEFLIALWQEMKVPYMGTFQFLLWVGDYCLYCFGLLIVKLIINNLIF